MMVSTGELRKPAERKLDMSVPVLKRQQPRALAEDDSPLASEETGSKGMKFTLLTKKGSKQQVGFGFVFFPSPARECRS